jgi:hypothetical protein
LFFFTPRLIADALFKAGDFKTALQWLHYIFNPTERLTQLKIADFVTPDVDESNAASAFVALKTNAVITNENQVSGSYTPTTSLTYLFTEVKDPVLRTRMIQEVRNVLFNHQTATLVGQFWRFQPFRNHTLSSLIAALTNPQQIAVYNSDPYDPYAIARLRIGAFEQATFCSYVDLLIAWGDNYFQRKTREYTNAAYLLYAMANDLLGPRPVSVGPCSDQLPVTFAEIQKRYGGDPTGIPQFLIDMENMLSVHGNDCALQLSGGAVNEVDALFCAPQNEMLLARWTTVENRLYKIRNCLDLDGNPLILPLFAPPIDPLSLVRAAAQSGSSGGFAEMASQAPKPQAYRFSTLINNARIAVSDMQSIGGDLEQAISSQNSETFMIMQSRHEQVLTQSQLTTYKERLNGAQKSRDALKASRDVTEQRKLYYDGLVSAGMNAPEELSIIFGLVSRIASFAAIGFETGAAIAGVMPQVGSPFAMTYGGQQIEVGLHRTSGTLRQVAEVADTARELSDTIGQFMRLSAEWQEQATEAGKELVQIDRQIEAAAADLAAAQADLDAHIISLNNTNTQLAFLENKFDNPDYYSWRASRASALYFQAYQLAMQAVEAAQSSLQWELGSTDAFLTTDPWDPSHRGLMAASTLNLVLDRMEFAFSQKNVLRQEITKEIYLSQLDPSQLVRLRESGEADIFLTEKLFDFDFPSHYCRRIKTCAVTLLPLDADLELEEVHAVITQTGNKILIEPTEAGLSYMLTGQGNPEGAVWQDWRANQTASLSKRSNDSGAFIEYYGDGEMLQRFEGTGAVSNWRYQLPKETNQFDFSTIEDVKLTLLYSALNGGDPHRKAVEKALSGQTYSAALMLNLAVARGKAWEAFFQDAGNPDVQTLAFQLPASLFPPNASNIVINNAILALVLAKGLKMPPSAKFMSLQAGKQPEQSAPSKGLAATVTYAQVELTQITGKWIVRFDLKAMKGNSSLAMLLDQSGHVSEDALANMFISLQFSASVFNEVSFISTKNKEKK